MFYSYDILNMRTGKLSIVWLVATSKIKMEGRSELRNILGTKVYKVCDDILYHITAQDPSLITLDHHPSKRFSLYLSTMLMYGTVKIYHYQLKILLDDVLDAFTNLQNKSRLIEQLLKTDYSKMKGRKSVAELLNYESAFFGDLNISLFPEIVAEPKAPRKVPSKRVVDKREEMEVIRQEQPVGLNVENLIHDWEDCNVSHRHLSTSDITLIEDVQLQPLQHQDIINAISTPIGDLGFGPSFMPELLSTNLENVLQAIEDYPIQQAVSDQQELPVITVAEEPASSKIDETAEEEGILPPIVETPVVTTTDPEMAPIKRKGKKPAPKPDEDITVVEEQLIEEKVTPVKKKQHKALNFSQIVLDPLTEKKQLRRTPISRRGKTFADEETQLSRELIQDSMKNFEDTLREQNAFADKIQPHLIRNIIPPKILLKEPREEIRSIYHQNLIKRHYNSLVENDFDETVEEIEPLDSTVRKDHSTINSMSTVSNVSQLVGNKTDPSLRASPLTTPQPVTSARLLTANSAEARMPPPEVPIIEEIPKDHGAALMPIADSVFASDLTPKSSLNPEESKKRKRIFSPEGGFTSGIVEAELHAEPKRKNQEISVAELAVTPAPLDQVESIQQVPASPQDEILFDHVSQNLTEQIVTQVQEYKDFGSIFDATKKRMTARQEELQRNETIFMSDLLPAKPTRADVAVTFSLLLEQHKMKKVQLMQRDNYGPIKIKQQSA